MPGISSACKDDWMYTFCAFFAWPKCKLVIWRVVPALIAGNGWFSIRIVRYSLSSIFNQYKIRLAVQAGISLRVDTACLSLYCSLYCLLHQRLKILHQFSLFPTNQTQNKRNNNFMSDFLHILTLWKKSDNNYWNLFWFVLKFVIEIVQNFSKSKKWKKTLHQPNRTHPI